MPWRRWVGSATVLVVAFSGCAAEGGSASAPASDPEALSVEVPLDVPDSPVWQSGPSDKRDGEHLAPLDPNGGLVVDPVPPTADAAPGGSPVPGLGPSPPSPRLSRAVQSDRLEAVVQLQGRLNELGYGPLDEDGRFGPATESAVVLYQIDMGLAVDGIVGPETWTHLFSRVVGGWSPYGRVAPLPRPTFTPSEELFGVPHDPSAVCADGSLSYSDSRSGTCSWHGGVGTWLD